VKPADLSGARDDAHLVQLWLAQRPESTRRVYAPVADDFLKALGCSIREASAAQVITWAEGLEGEPATRARKVATIKSLLGWAHRVGYTVFNVGRALRCVPVPSKIHERILEKPEVAALVEAAKPGRDRAFLRLMYVSGARISELCKLRWVDIRQPGRMTVLGKGRKVRTIVVPQKVLDEVLALRGPGVELSAPVFCSMKRPGRGLGVRDAREIVYRARKRAEMDRKASPHWLRHSHATHALDGGCPIHKLQASLGHSSLAVTGRYLHVRPSEGSSDYLDV